MGVTIKAMETDEEIRGKAFVHWKTWHEAYPGLVSDEYLERFTLEKCEDIAFRWASKWPENTLVALEGDRVTGFVSYGDRGDERPDAGEIFAIYVLPERWGTGTADALMKAARERLTGYPEICLWVLKDNARAIRFYEKQGFAPDGEELFSGNVRAWEIRMAKKNGTSGRRTGEDGGTS